MKHALLLLLALLLVGCPPTPAPDPKPQPQPAPSSGTCASACDRARELGCQWAAATADGASCETVCSAAQKLEAWNLTCRTLAPSCVAAENCEQ